MAQSGSIEAESVARAAGPRAAAIWPKELFQVSPVCFSIIINLVRFVNVRLRIDPRRLAYFSAWTVKLETRAQRTTPTVMGWVCIKKKKSFPRVSANCTGFGFCSNLVLEKLNNILQLPSSCIYIYIYLAKEESPMLQVEYAVRVQKAGWGPGG